MPWHAGACAQVLSGQSRKMPGDETGRCAGKPHENTGKAVKPRHAPATDQTMATAESMVATETLAMQALSAFRE